MISYALLDTRRLLRNTGGIIFTILMPAGFYLIFGATQPNLDTAVAHGNVKATIMVSMAVYGAIMAVTMWGSQAALEQQRGWGRQLALTPMTPLKYVFSKVLTIETVALVPLAIVFVTGAATNARADGLRWLWTFLLCCVCSMPFTLFGLAVALLVRGETATGITSFCIVALSFLGNMFIPLSGFILKVSRFTPMYGPGQLTRMPLIGKQMVTMDGVINEPVWRPVVSIIAWTIIMGIVAVLVGRRRQNR